MPKGVMRWFDPRSGEGMITSRRGDFPVTHGDVEPHARVAGARVHFDVVRADGATRAVRVSARTGGRTSRRHGRFGDLKGTHHPEAKGHPSSLPAPEPHEHRPMEVAQRWLKAVRSGDIQAAAAMYAPDAVLHTPGGGATTGARAVQRWLQDTGGSAPWASAELHAHDATIDVLWRAGAEQALIRGPRVRVAHGRIAELWDEPTALR